MGLLFTGGFPQLEADLADRVRELRDGSPLEPLTVVVGSFALGGHVRRLLVAGLGAYAGIEVVTLDGLARRVAAIQSARTAAGGDGLRPLSWLARERLVRQLLAMRRAGAGLRYIEPVAETPGLAAAFVRSIDDLRQGRVDAGVDLRRAVVRGDKGADLGAVYREYCATLGTRALADAATVYEQAASWPGDGRRLLLYGLADLNGVQERFVRALAASGRLDAFVPVPPSGSAWSSVLAACLHEAGLEPSGRGPSRSLETSGAGQGDRRALERVEARLFDESAPRPAVAPDGSVAIVSAVSDRAEVREAARECLAQASRMRFHEMAVVAPNGELADAVGEALLRLGLPVARSLPDGSRHVRGLAHLLDAIAPERGEAFERRAVVAFLLTSQLRDAPDPALVALWADEARRAGIVAGEAQWRDRLRRHEGSLEARLASLSSDDEDDDGDGDGPTPAAVKRVSLERRVAAVRALRLCMGRLFKAAARLPSGASWTDHADRLGSLVHDLVELPADAGISGELGQLAALAAVERSASLHEAVATLREALAGRRIRHGSLGERGVAVLTPLQCRGLAFRLVVCVGLSEAGFPPRPRQDPILLDADRLRIAQTAGAALPLAAQREAESRFLFAALFEAARERLVLVYPRLDAETGRPLLPSRYLLRVVRALTGADVPPEKWDEIDAGMFRRASGTPAGFLVGAHGAPVAPAPAGAGAPVRLDAVDERELDVALLSTAAGDGRQARRMAVAAGYLASLVGAGVAERRRRKWTALRDSGVGPWDAVITDPAVLGWLRGHDPFRDEVSPSALETYIRCPFVFLLTQVLGLVAPSEPAAEAEMEHTEYGKLAHEILHGVYQRAKDDALDRDGALRVLPEVAAAACAVKEEEGVTGAPVVWHARRDLLLEDLAHVVQTDPVFGGDERGPGRPLELEWSFGEGHGRPVSLATPAAELQFKGRVDRVDVTDDGALRVLDYKTGSGSAEDKRVKACRSVQLPVYLLAVRRCLARADQAIGCSYQMVTRKGSFKPIALPDDEDATLAGLAELCGAVAAAAADGLYPRSPVSTWGCGYCDLRYACDIDAWSHQRKRKALERLDVIQKGGACKEAGDDA